MPSSAETVSKMALMPRTSLAPMSSGQPNISLNTSSGSVRAYCPMRSALPSAANRSMRESALLATYPRSDTGSTRSRLSTITDRSRACTAPLVNRALGRVIIIGSTGHSGPTASSHTSLQRGKVPGSRRISSAAS
ncbi:hypothetical protein [Actinomadura sp. B10D3]|uniref:hypothetical protein n=1 Tax=Actinomadura sp. B10D3 TaxID=3153557 RepID=UPI00325C44A0